MVVTQSWFVTLLSFLIAQRDGVCVCVEGGGEGVRGGSGVLSLNDGTLLSLFQIVVA